MRPSPHPTVVLAPDSFKGSLGAPSVALAMARGLQRVWPQVELRSCPMADGGEGTLDAVLAASGARGARRAQAVRGAGGAPVDAAYGVLDDPDGAIAVVEMAKIVGITDRVAMAVPVAARSTAGVGDLLRALLDGGVRRFLVGLGGSSTNDAGAGLLGALGARLLDASGAAIAPSGWALGRVEKVDVTGLDRRLEKCELILLSDVDSPLSGPHGATAVFGLQKGVPEEEIAVVDAAVARFAERVESALGRSAATQPGAGAAGGLGFALQMLGGTFRAGAEIVADLVHLDAALQGADWLLTGEGRSDAQTLAGKAPFVAASRARKAGVPATLLSGALDADALSRLGEIFAGCFALPAGPTTLAESVARADTLIADRTEQLARFWGARGP